MQLPSTKCDRVKSRWSKNCTHRHSRTISIKIQATDWTEIMLLTHSFAFWTSVSTTPSVHKPLQQYILKCLIIYTFYFIFSNLFIYLFRRFDICPLRFILQIVSLHSISSQYDLKRTSFCPKFNLRYFNCYILIHITIIVISV